MRVLIADDHETLRRGVRVLVSSLNMEVCGEAANGFEAIAKCQELKPDVVIMDLVMPELDGLQATHQIRRVSPSTQIIFLSQHDLPQARNEALKAGATSYVAKSSLWKLVLILKKVQFGDAPLRLQASAPPLDSMQLSVVAAAGAGVGIGSVSEQQNPVAVAAPDRQTMAEDLDLMTNSVPAGMNCCSRDLRYIWANPDYAKLLQRPLNRIVGRNILDVVGKAAFGQLSPYFDQVLAGDKVAFEAEIAYEGIGSRRISAIYRPTFDGKRSPDGWFAFVRNLTQRK